MKKRMMVVIAVVAVLILASAASANIFDTIRARFAPVTRAEVSPVGEDISDRPDMPKEPWFPTKYDVGYYAFGERGHGIWGDSVDYSGVYGSSRDDAGILALTSKGREAVWGYNSNADTTGLLAGKMFGVKGIVHDSEIFSGLFEGGKGVYSENGYATKYMGKEEQIPAGQYTFTTADGKRITVTNGIVTAIERM